MNRPWLVFIAIVLKKKNYHQRADQAILVGFEETLGQKF
jgi:hypothetical protein